MKPAVTAKRHLADAKLLVFSEENRIVHSRFGELAEFLQPGDLLVINRSATLPAGFTGRVERTGEKIEIRLAAFLGPAADRLENWLAFSFGHGDWRMSTEDRGRPPVLRAGDRVVIGKSLTAHILEVRDERLLRLKFSAVSLVQELYRHGRPIQYSYHREELEVWDQQTIFSGPPVSVEPPSASFQLTWRMFFDLRARGVKTAFLLHSAGISSTGNSKLDSLLPLSEWYEIPRETAAAIREAKAGGHQVIALGTTVLRALESTAVDDQIAAGTGLSRLKIIPGYRFRVVDALVTGMHEPGSSHLEILKAICPLPLINEGYRQAEARGYRGHEFGDLSLLNCRCATG